MKLKHMLIALLTCLGTLASIASATAQVPAVSEHATTTPVASASATEPAKITAPVAPRPRASKPIPVTTVGYLEGSVDLPLPGVGVIPGGIKPELENNVIRITSNRTEVVNVSATLTNRIATPFQSPKAILLDGGATVTAEGQSLYIALDGAPRPVALYVTGSQSNDPVVSLTLMPQSLPPQTIVLQLDGFDKTVAGGGSSGRDDNPNSPVYTERLVGILRSVALGNTPDGFVQGRLPVAAANFGNFSAIPLARFSSSAYDVYRYRLVTESHNTIELDEAAFASEGVRAVAFFPSALIAKNAPTEVYVVADKKATQGGW